MSASSLYMEHFQLHRPPFDQEPDTSVFFTGGGREELLRELAGIIAEGTSFVKLVGSEGTGKTLFCRILAERIDHDRYRPVYLEHPIGSYENLLRTICLELGDAEEVLGEDESSRDYVELFRRNLDRLGAEGKIILLILDEAENIFLATLERLVRLICADREKGNFQVLLSGRLEINERLEQLAVYCEGLDVNAGCVLEPLDPEETGEYIRFRLQRAGITGEKHLDLFSEGAVEAVFQGSMGNISLINTLAGQGMKNACAEGMFRVEEQMIPVQQSVEENVSLALFQGYDFLRDHKWWLVGGALLVWLLLVLLWPEGERKHQDIAGDEQLEIITPAAEIVPPPEPEVTERLEPPPVPVESGQVEEEPVPETSVTEEPALASTPVVEPPPPAEKVEPEEPEQKVLRPEGRKKIVITGPTPAPPEETVLRDGDALYNERVKATSSWLAWAYRGGYTVQLMVLASKNAEENLKKILVDDRYYEVRDHLYILRKRSPRTIYLFYGSYPDIDEARAARNAMPPFLRETRPYVLSIRDALKKIEE
ncbi:MAG: hypothetical protein Kow0089_16520 [Desulfobulbaceae bacterium]